MSNTTNLQLPYLDANQNQKTVTVNQALTMLDALVNCGVQNTTLTAPPASPADGQCWIVASDATGAWAGKDLNVAAWQDGAWVFYPPTTGMLAFNDATATLLCWTGASWVSALAAITQLQLAALGIGTAPDSGNPLSASLNNALFNALATGSGGTGDIRVKLNKAAAANTASFLFQDGFSGRAEIGLTGDDNFHFKVSADGTTFRDALVLNAATGDVQVPSLNSGPLAGLRNRLLNGNVAVNQRAVSGTVTLSAGQYGHDRWKAGAGGCTYSFATSGIDTVITITAGSLMQVVEGANVEGGSYTLSWSGSAQGRVFQGSAGAYAAGPLTVTGLSANTAVTVQFSTGTIGLVQLEPGIRATPFERRPASLELLLCQRYTWVLNTPVNAYQVVGYAAASGAQMFSTLAFPAPMRVNPTLSFIGTWGTDHCTVNLIGMGNQGLSIFLSSTAAGNFDAYSQANTGIMAVAEL